MIEKDKNTWKVGEAKQHFSEVLRRSAVEPQLIYRRNRLIAKVVAVEEPTKEEAANRVTIADRFAELREIFRQENFRLRTTRRRDRPNDFVKALDEVSRRHKRSK
jgi:antitoxin (DNA-binding transcriptional repressor) of toxin-antitoxin stability system